ncbi:DUF6086 family protein [Streptomyces sp. XD-27]|uniref:DUF6086 family protein n=1 Tax=Streptomyces sp. XD-27 TaxID=3062779 RepID=UPI0026F4339B|nr:DUF6086 family protein [Streptomyces sp. XD-27]WKX69381.1 DUF6086 family protein [Streptomyces sp. XD-27]
MSQYFDMGEETLWNPSNGASRLFLRQVAVFEAELGLASGIGPMEADECQIDPAALGVFVHALLTQYRRTHHSIVPALSEGFVATMLVLADRAGVGVCWTPTVIGPDGGLADVQAPAEPAVSGYADEDAWAHRLREKARELDRMMAR